MLRNILSFLLFFSASLAFAQTFPFPSYTATVSDTSIHGYYFLCPFKPAQVFSPQYNMILDAKGRVIYYQTPTKGNFELLQDSLMGYNTLMRYLMLDSTFTVVDTMVCKNGISQDGHERKVLPNGHFLLLGTEVIQMDLSSYNMFYHNGSPGSPTAMVQCGVIQEQDENKNVVFEWHAKDYFAFDDADSAFFSSPDNVDWTHCNALELDTDGNILLSSRHLNEITKINRSDSTIIWRFGGKRDQFTFTNDPQMFRGQHDIRRIANGHITLFDNGTFGPPLHTAAAKEYQIDETLLTATLTWSYVENPASFSMAMGNVQRLSNGNTLVNFGSLLNENIVFTVVNQSGAKLFTLAFDDGSVSYRAFYYPALPFQLHKPQISCYAVSGQYYLDAGSGYSGYLWSNGDTTQAIAVTAADTFFVFVPMAMGYISSEYFIVTNASDPCGITSAGDIGDEFYLSLFPNPASDELNITSHVATGKLQHCLLSVYNVPGEKVMEEKILLTPVNSLAESRHTINIKNLPQGIYFTKVQTGNSIITSRFVKE